MIRDPNVVPIALPGSLPGERRRQRWATVVVAVEPMAGSPPRVRYRWDADTEILLASIVDRRGGGAVATSVELEGRDGSWVTLELRGGRLCGVEVAVWPRVRLLGAIPRPEAAPGHVACPAVGALAGVSDAEVETVLAVDAERGGRAVRLRVGPSRATRAVQVARDMLVDVDDAGMLAGVWLLGVPPLQLPS